MTRNFRQMLEAKWTQGKFVCVGLDTDYAKIPKHLKEKHKDIDEAMLQFNIEIIEATKDIVCAYKPNSAFYERRCTRGVETFYCTMAYIHKNTLDVPIIYDVKRGDIGNTNDGYVEAAFGDSKMSWMADAITINPYLGEEANLPFLNQKDKGIIILCRTSNASAKEFQDLVVSVSDDERKQIAEHAKTDPAAEIRLYQYVAFRTYQHWNKNKNCALVVGATYPHELAWVRNLVGEMPILIPGIGAQGGDLEKTVLAGKDSGGKGMIINSSRGIIYASSGKDFAEVAKSETQKLHDSINNVLKRGKS